MWLPWKLVPVVSPGAAAVVRWFAGGAVSDPGCSGCGDAFGSKGSATTATASCRTPAAGLWVEAENLRVDQNPT